MPENPVKIGIIGLGRSGWNIHAAALAKLPEHYQVVAVADPDAARRDEAEQRFGCTGYPDPEALLADETVEVVTVATPSFTHVPTATAALEAGKHVLVEKPIAETVDEVDQLVDLAQRQDRVLMPFQNQRLEPSFLQVREIIDSGQIGEPLLIRRTTHRYSRRDDWQTLRRMGGGELPNTTVHFLDQLLTLVPDAELEIFADLRHTITAGDAEDHVKLTIRPDQGPVIDIESSLANAAPQESWYVIGTLGAITGSPAQLQLRCTDLSDLPERNASDAAAQNRAYPKAEDLEWTESTIEVDTTDRRATGFYERLYNTVRNGADPFVTMASVRRVVDVIATARQQTNFP